LFGFFELFLVFVCARIWKVDLPRSGSDEFGDISAIQMTRRHQGEVAINVASNVASIDYLNRRSMP
jgi:hypothetical protein